MDENENPWREAGRGLWYVVWERLFIFCAERILEQWPPTTLLAFQLFLKALDHDRETGDLETYVMKPDGGS